MKLLVSVRSAEEATAALEGGADVIDVKEPSRGSLGRADDSTILAVLQCVADRRPVSAALGELIGIAPNSPREPGLSALRYVKWGLAGCGSFPLWDRLFDAAARPLPRGCRPVAAAYADWRRAQAPRPENVCAMACDRRCGAYLLDTWRKDGKTLLDFLSVKSIDELACRCAHAGVPIALAGSLGLAEIEQLLPLVPDWFAVRGAVCHGGKRTEGIDRERVRRLADFLARSASKAFLAGASG